MTYWGKWGEKIRIGRETNNIWSSSMCGISGSTQFTLFSYLLAIGASSSGSQNPTLDIRNLFSLAVAILTGDGGHSVREIVYGITLSIILMHTLLKEIESELQNLCNNKCNLSENIEKNFPNIPRGPILGAIMRQINYRIPKNLDCPQRTRINKDVLKRNLVIFGELMIMCRKWDLSSKKHTTSPGNSI